MRFNTHLPFSGWALVYGLVGTVATCCAADEAVRFNRDVLPILAEKCLACHGFDAKHREAGLRLDVAESATVALESGARAIVPGKPAESELVRRIESTDPELVMPPPSAEGKALTAEQRQILKRWIEQGAPYERHWAFLPPVQIEPPTVPGAHHVVDRFVHDRLAREHLVPSPEAEATTLIRRVSLDLIGLPPTVAEVDAFLAARQADPEGAYRDVVDRLLDSPHFGERWGRWWLDQARYADSNGYSIDAPREIWKYRDWVVDALNADLPFDQFTIEQLAGDLLPQATVSQQIATGFHRNTQINQEGGIDKEQFRIDSVFDRVATTGTVWLGLTLGCAQCHSHKFDPIEQREYYRLFAIFNSQDEPVLRVHPPGVNANALARERKSWEERLEKLAVSQSAAIVTWESQLTAEARQKLSREVRTALGVAADQRKPAHLRTLYTAGPGAGDKVVQEGETRLKQIDEELNQGTTTMVLQELPQPRRTTVFIQGDFTRPADEVTPGTPAVLHPFEPTHSPPNRLDFARWLVSPRNPLTARVIVNRIWQQYFGRGLVETENDFGMVGRPPTHPELLDWLAIELMRGGWSLKKLHRLVVTSHTYRQAAIDRPELREKDPDNYLLGRQRRLRLDAELVRDTALVACGLLSAKRGGPPVFPPIPDGVMSQGQVKREWKVSSGEDRYRRGLYTFVFRATPPPSLNVFDAPDGYSSCTRRNRSNTPLQALTLLNDAAFFEFAQALEKIIRAEGLEQAFRRCTSRRPAAEELAILQRLDPLNAARALLNLDETVTRE